MAPGADRISPFADNDGHVWPTTYRQVRREDLHRLYPRNIIFSARVKGGARLRRRHAKWLLHPAAGLKTAIRVGLSYNVDNRMQMNTSEFPDGSQRRDVSPEDIRTGRGSIWRN
ncbi:hypothetical protein CHELA20_54007 [Hyphomicrobiales bacterium]|nr:hypothetical protein CHELA41_20919 [Hyphomicrobiales bacterium]CAH1685402.1 hypothetical protein CHELA20_54007 [Hyphomicrobiales bacterium]